METEKFILCDNLLPFYSLKDRLKILTFHFRYTTQQPETIDDPILCGTETIYENGLRNFYGAPGHPMHIYDFELDRDDSIVGLKFFMKKTLSSDDDDADACVVGISIKTKFGHDEHIGSVGIPDISYYKVLSPIENEFGDSDIRNCISLKNKIITTECRQEFGDSTIKSFTYLIGSCNIHIVRLLDFAPIFVDNKIEIRTAWIVVRKKNEFKI